MALPGGYRYAVPMADLFPHGVYAVSVEQAQDFDERTSRRTPTKDKANGEFVWTVTVMDRDPEARVKEVKVKVTAPVMPVLPGEVLAGSGLHQVEFSGLTVTPYVVEGAPGRRPKQGASIRATGMHALGKAPTGSATMTGRSGGPGMPPPGAGDHKAA